MVVGCWLLLFVCGTQANTIFDDTGVEFGVVVNKWHLYGVSSVSGKGLNAQTMGGTISLMNS